MRTIFTKGQIEELKQNPCVFECRERSIHYTYEFKKRALELYTQGIKPKEIWRQAGRVRRLELQVQYLEKENDFLAKLRAKRAESASGRVKNTNLSES